LHLMFDFAGGDCCDDDFDGGHLVEMP